MVDLGTISLSLVVAILTAIISPYIIHKLNMNRMRQELFFKKKLEYFEKLSETIQDRYMPYVGLLMIFSSPLIKNKHRKIREIGKKIDTSMNGLKPGPNYLYFDSKNLNDNIANFALIETTVALQANNLAKKIKNDNTELINTSEFIEYRDNLRKLTQIAENIINIMNSEMKK